MTDQIVRLGPEYFSDPTVGRPVAAGSVYIGKPDTDPEIVGNQITVDALQENGTTVPISQPILTSAGGQPLYNGSPVTLLVSETYSLKVLDSFGVQKNYVPSTDVPIDIATSGILQLDDLQALLAISAPSNDDTYITLSFFDGEGNGGGTFYWDASQDKADANGAIIIDPDNIGGYDGTVSTLSSYFADQGVGVGVGCWIRICDRTALVTWFGVINDPLTNNAIALQMALNFLRSSYDTDLDAFDNILDFGGKIYRTETSLDFTLLRQPGSTIQNGGIHGACAGKIVLDMAGTNTATLKDFLIYGDDTDTPSVGVLLSRAEISGGFPGAAGNKLINVFINGYFTKACHINFASEVSQCVSCRFLNRSRAINAYAFINVGNAATLDSYISGLTSDYVTLPLAVNGSLSNILHYHQQAHIQRASDIVISIDSITKANPAVVEVDPTDLTNSGLTGGDVVYFHDIAGMTELNYNWYTVANINLPAGTFELQGVDSTAYTTFVSGNVWNQTGPAVLLSETNSMYCNAGYILTYGNAPIRVDLQDVAPIRDCKLAFQAEAHPYTIMELRRTSLSEANIQGLDLDLLNTNQVIDKDAIRITGGGLVKINNLKLKINNMGVVPQNGLFQPVGSFRLNNAHISAPLAAALNDNADFIGFNGLTSADDDNIFSTVVDNVEFQATATALVAPGLRFVNDSLYAYREEISTERRVHVQDNDITSNFVDSSSRINNFDKYTGKPAFNVGTLIPLWAAGGGTTDVWVDATGATIHTPV